MSTLRWAWLVSFVWLFLALGNVARSQDVDLSASYANTAGVCITETLDRCLETVRITVDEILSYFSDDPLANEIRKLVIALVNSLDADLAAAGFDNVAAALREIAGLSNDEFLSETILAMASIVEDGGLILLEPSQLLASAN